MHVSWPFAVPARCHGSRRWNPSLRGQPRPRTCRRPPLRAPRSPSRRVRGSLSSRLPSREAASLRPGNAAWSHRNRATPPAAAPRSPACVLPVALGKALKFKFRLACAVFLTEISFRMQLTVKRGRLRWGLAIPKDAHHVDNPGWRQRRSRGGGALHSAPTQVCQHS